MKIIYPGKDHQNHKDSSGDQPYLYKCHDNPFNRGGHAVFQPEREPGGFSFHINCDEYKTSNLSFTSIIKARRTVVQSCMWTHSQQKEMFCFYCALYWRVTEIWVCCATNMSSIYHSLKVKKNKITTVININCWTCWNHSFCWRLSQHSQTRLLTWEKALMNLHVFVVVFFMKFEGHSKCSRLQKWINNSKSKTNAIAITLSCLWHAQCKMKSVKDLRIWIYLSVFKSLGKRKNCLSSPLDSLYDVYHSHRLMA